MWRSLLAGVVVVGALVLVFVGSFGGPTTTVPDRSNIAPGPQPPVSQTAPDPSGPAPAAVNTPAQTGDALQQRRDALLQKLQDLQTKVAQAVQDTIALRKQADETWSELDAMRKQAPGDQPVTDTARPAVGGLPQAQPSDTRSRAEAAVTNPTEQAAGVARVTQPQSVQTQHDVKAAASPPAAAPRTSPRPAQPAVQPAPKPQPSVPDAREAVLARLRHQTPSHAETPRATTDEQPVVPPRQRLMDARTAVEAGRFEDAERLLQQAQVQLVLRPTSPDQDASVTGSVAAGQVAEALSMLGAGDVRHAVHYINLAAAQADQGPTVAAATAPSDLPH